MLSSNLMKLKVSTYFDNIYSGDWFGDYLTCNCSSLTMQFNIFPFSITTCNCLSAYLAPVEKQVHSSFYSLSILIK